MRAKRRYAQVGTVATQAGTNDARIISPTRFEPRRTASIEDVRGSRKPAQAATGAEQAWIARGSVARGRARPGATQLSWGVLDRAALD